MPEPRPSVDRNQSPPEDPNDAYSSVFDQEEEGGPLIFENVQNLEPIDATKIQVGDVIYLEGVTLIQRRETGPNSSEGAWGKTDYYPYQVVEDDGVLYAVNLRSTPTFPPGSMAGRLHAIGRNRKPVSNLDPDKIYRKTV